MSRVAKFYTFPGQNKSFPSDTHTNGFTGSWGKNRRSIGVSFTNSGSWNLVKGGLRYLFEFPLRIVCFGRLGGLSWTITIATSTLMFNLIFKMFFSTGCIEIHWNTATTNPWLHWKIFVQNLSKKLLPRFIDGLHTYDAVVEDLRFWSPKVRFGGCCLE